MAPAKNNWIRLQQRCRRQWHVGERVTMGSTVAVLLADAAPYARVYVPEPWRAHLHVGDRKPVSVDGIAQPLTGTLRWISSEAAFTPYFALNATDRARLVYLAEFDLEGGEALPTGVPAQVLLGDD
jgi:HlyD family secretion protein